MADSDSDVEVTATDAEDLEELGDAEDLDEEELEDLEGDDDLEEDDDLGLDVLVDDAEDPVGEDVPVGLVVAPPAAEAEEAEGEDEDDLDDDEVEAGLDVILKERLVVADEDESEDEEEEETVDVDDRGDGTTRVLPKQPGEFVCQSCFLVKNETQLADPKRNYCRDCV